MGSPAAVLGDKVTATCAIHLVPNPASGAPQPGPPMPFSAPVTTGTCATVQVGGKPVVVVGAQGTCTPPHVGLHPSDPFLVPPTQTGVVVQGSATVLAGGTPLARSGDACTACAVPGASLVGTGTTVMVGG
jgi:uncharacterized Zn-binding protein involved in type VI secretion